MSAVPLVHRCIGGMRLPAQVFERRGQGSHGRKGFGVECVPVIVKAHCGDFGAEVMAHVDVKFCGCGGFDEHAVVVPKPV